MASKRTPKNRNHPPRKSGLKEKIRILELLLEFGKKAAAERSIDSLLELLAREAQTILAADRCTIFLLDRKKKLLWSKVAHGSSEIITIPWNRGIAGEVVRSQELLNIPDAYHDPRFNRDVDKKTNYRTRTILAAPMLDLHKQTVGVFQVLNKKSGGAFDRNDEEILKILANQAAVAVETTRLYEQVKRGAVDTIFRLAAAAEYKDRDTASHLMRMSRYSYLIAQALGFSQDYCELLHLASPMHDIGKLGVPDSVLLKPGKLSPEEWAEMKKHPLHGAEILKNSENELLQMSERIALTHHEKFDGFGYPRGVKGGAIPIEGRIVALADAFDAMTSKRVYKEKFTLEETLKLIRQSIGRHFDPDVVEAFEKALPEITQVMQQFADHPEEQHPEPPKDSPGLQAG